MRARKASFYICLFLVFTTIMTILSVLLYGVAK